jgi:hypothetical protein
LFRFCSALFRSRAALAAENLFLHKQLALFQEREKKTKAATAADRFVVLQALSAFRLAQRIGYRQTSHSDWLASSGIPPVLALEVKTCRKTTSSGRRDTLDPSHGSRKPDLG